MENGRPPRVLADSKMKKKSVEGSFRYVRIPRRPHQALRCECVTRSYAMRPKMQCAVMIPRCG